MPLTILEAYSLGTLVIGSNLGGIPEIIKKVSKNLIFNHKNFEELKEITLGLKKNKYDIEKIKKVYNNHFSFKSYLHNYGGIL